MRFAHEEVNNNCTGETASRKNIAISVIDGRGNVRREEAEQEVEGPVGSSCQSHALRTVSGRVDFSNDGPDNWAPCHGKPRDEQTREDDHSVTNALVRSAVTIRKGKVTERGEDKEAHEHPERSVDQRRSTTKLLHNVKSGEGHAKVHGAKDDRSNVGVGYAYGVEDRGAVIEVVTFLC